MKYIPAILLLVLFLAGIGLYESDLSPEEAAKALTNEESKFLRIQGMDLHYRVEGEGLPLVLLHGTGSMLQTWDDWTNALKNHFRIIRFDLPGFGLTGPNPERDYSMRFYTSVLAELADSLSLDSFFLAGNSLGGQIAWEYAIDHPGKVKKLVLLAPAGVKSKAKSTLVFKLAKYETLSTLLQNFGTRFFVQKTLNDIYADPSRINPGMANLYHIAALRAGNRRAFMDRLSAPLDENKVERLTELNMPVMLLWGNRDVLVPHTLAPRFQKLISNSELKIYPGAGHIPMEEIPDLSVNDVVDFLIN